MFILCGEHVYKAVVDLADEEDSNDSDEGGKEELDDGDDSDVEKPDQQKRGGKKNSAAAQVIKMQKIRTRTNTRHIHCRSPVFTTFSPRDRPSV